MQTRVANWELSKSQGRKCTELKMKERSILPSHWQSPERTGVASEATFKPLGRVVTLVSGADVGCAAGEGYSSPGRGSVKGVRMR